MGFRNIKIEGNTRLHIKNGQLILDNGTEVSIPLEDINCILIENPSVMLSSYFLQKAADCGIAVYVCDGKHHPSQS